MIVSSGNQEAASLRSSTASSGRVRWLGSALGFLALAWPFFPFVSPWRLRYSRAATGKAKTLVGAQNGCDNEDAEDDPVMPPTDQWFLAAGNERVVVHAGAVEGQPSSAAERVIDGPKERGARCEDGDDELGEVRVRRRRGPRRRG